MTFQTTCGAANGPSPGQNTFTSELFGKCLVNFLIVNNVPENQLNPSPDFSHNYTEKCITRTNPWILGDKIIVDYTPIKTCDCNA